VEMEIKHLTSAMDGMHELTVGSREEFGFECVGIFSAFETNAEGFGSSVVMGNW